MVAWELLQVLVVVGCLRMNNASPSCQDENSPPSPPSPPPLLSRFTDGVYSVITTEQEIKVQLDSREECAQFCVQVTEAGILNCTGFQHEGRGECLVKSSEWCKQTTNSSNGTSSNYILKGYNITHCTNSSSSSSKQVVNSAVVINITTVILNVQWQETLMNSTSTTYRNLSSSIEYNIFQLYVNDSVVNAVNILQYSNHTTHVQAKLSIDFYGNASMTHFRILFTALYQKRLLHHLQIDTVWENLPGKPPTNLTVSHSDDGTAVLSWAHAYNNPQIKTLGYRVLYSYDNPTDSMVTAYTKNVKLKELKPLTNYSIAVMSVTNRGFGIQSVILTTTLKAAPRPLVVNITILLNDKHWSDDLLNKTHLAFISLKDQLKINIFSLYNNQSDLREITVYSLSQFNISDSNVSRHLVQAKIGMSYYKTNDMVVLFKSIYKHHKLNNITVSPVQDNIPGKPVTNITWMSTTPQSIMVSWSSSPSPQCGYVIFYRHNATIDIHNVTVNSTSSSTTIYNLLPLTHYVIWIQSITVNGPGIPSDVISALTIEQIVNVDVKVLLVNETWNDDNHLLNLYIKRNVTNLFLNVSQFRNTTCVIRNASRGVVAEISVSFGQDVKMRHFSVLYYAVYVIGHLGSIAVEPQSDTIPGKPPKDLSATPTGTTTVSVRWSTYPDSNAIQWLVFYQLLDANNVTIQNSTQVAEKGANQTTLEGLQKFAYYLIWIRSVTEWGYGIPSQEIFVRTLEEVLRVNITIVLPTIPWNIDLLNSSSQHHSNVSFIVKNSVRNLHFNDAQLKTVEIIRYVNMNNITKVEVTLIYGQNVKSSELNRLYKAIYTTRRLDQLNIEPVTDTIPGKPPSNVSATANSTTSVLLTWDPVPLKLELRILSLQVTYVLTSNSQNVSVISLQSNKTVLLVSGLEKFRNYTFWVTCVTRIGTGIPSGTVYARTLEEFVPIQATVRFPSLTWNTNLSQPESEAYRQLCDVIKGNVYQLYGDDDSQLRNVECNEFRNGSVIADLTIVYGQHVNMSHFSTLFKALYVDGKLYNITVKPIADNVPGKPPKDLSATPTGTTTVSVRWSTYPDSNATQWLVFYQLLDANNVTIQNSTQVAEKGANQTTLEGLQKFAYYLIWIRSVTEWGYGIPSQEIFVRTLEEVLRVNITVVLPTIPWNIDLLNSSSQHHSNVSFIVKNSVRNLHSNDTQLKTVEIIRYVNINNITKVEVTLIYGQNVKSSELNRLYKAIYTTRRLDQLNIEPVTDTIPGKPPSNVSATANSTTSVLLTWDPVPLKLELRILSLQVTYILTSNSPNISVISLQSNKTVLLVSGLEKFRNYTFWVTCVTRIGTGIPSGTVYARTLEEFVPIQATVRFPSLTWNTNLSQPESEAYRQLCDVIKGNVYQLYGDDDSQLRNVECNEFRNGSVIADLTIVYGQHVNMSHFSTLFKALYVDGKLYNITVQPIADNVPGKPPHNVTALAITSTSIRVSWSCPDCETTNNTIAFLITYKPRDSNITQGITVNSTVRHMTILGLKKFTSYELLVASVTSRGVGITSSPVYNTTLQDVPSQAPSTLTAYNTSSTSLMVDWGEIPIGYIHGILQGYTIQFKKLKDLNGNWTTVTVAANVTNTSLTSLDKFTEYVITVKAFTVVGWGPSRNVTTSTDEDVPSLPPSNIQARNISSTAIEVTWSRVRSGFTHGIVTGYHVLYRRSNDSNTTYMVATTHARSNLTLRLTDLNKYTEYSLKMMAFTRIGNGTESKEIAVYTDEDTPSLPPPNVQAYNTSSTSLNVTWNPIMPTYFVHGILRGYRILYKQTDDVNGSYSNVTTLSNDYELKELKKFTKYFIKVLAFTSKGDGVDSRPFNVSTDEDVPSRPPMNLNGHNTSSTNLYLSWDPVPRGFVNGILLGYKVLFKRINDKSWNYTDTVTTNTTREVVLVGLKKFTIYRITVLAFTSKGDGPEADNVTVTTDEDIPTLPPTNLTARNTSSTSLLIKWGPVPNGHVHGILRGYRILYKMADDVIGNFSNNISTTQSANLAGLKKYTVYLVKVLAYTVKGDGPMTHNVSISTDEDVPSLPPTNVSSHNTSATSLNVTWSDIPSGFVHGILLGYRVLYSIHRRRSDRSLGGSHMTATVTSPIIQTLVLKGLENFTEYNIEVLGYTRIGDGMKSNVIKVTTDENVPGKPPQNLNGNNASSTSIQVYWDPVPKGFVYGILRGYRIMYKIITDNTYVNKTLGRNSKNVLLSGLLKYTKYDIKILAFTRIGDGVHSQPIRVQTDEDIPSMAPQNVQVTNKISSTEIPIKWRHIPKAYVHGVLRGYHIKYKLVKLADINVEDHGYSLIAVSYYETNATLRNLESFAIYEIQIAGFTIKGDGVWETVYGTTCRCHSDLHSNWFSHPPYVRDDSSFSANESTFNNLTTDIKGIFPPILYAAVKTCCGDCAVESSLILSEKGYKKVGMIQVKDSINNDTDFNFPIDGIKGQTKYQGNQGEFEFVSIMDMPGAAFLVADRRDIHSEVLHTILGCWPTVVFVFVVAYLSGIVIWIIDVRFNPDHFPNSFLAGSWEGFWWSYITMTTVGYGDRIPKSIAARLFSVVWIWMGIATIAVLTSSITASLMSMVFRTQLTLYGTKVAAINNSSEYKLGVRRNANLKVGRMYGNITEIYNDLLNENVHAALLDSYATASQKDLFDKKWLRVRDIIKTGFDSTYGVVLSGNAMKLGQCIRHYVKVESSEISRVVQKNVAPIKASKVPPAVKRSSDLLTAESELFRLTAKILGGSLAVLVGLCLIWEYHRKWKMKRKKENKKNCEKDVEGSWPSWAKLPAQQRYEMTKAQYRQDLEHFYKSFREAYEMLRKKHSLQIKTFHNQCKGIHNFSVSEWTGGRSATYTVTKDTDVNSILDGLDMSMFDGKDIDKKIKMGL